MDYKTILVPLDHPDRCESVVRTAVQVAENFNSMVQGIYVVPSLQTLESLASGGAGPAVVMQRRDELNRRGVRCRKIFESILAETRRDWSWSQIESEHEVVSHEVLKRAQTADLVVLSQTPVDEEILFVAEIPERVLLSSGRPVIVVPPQSVSTKPVLRNALVAWDGSRESVRALADSLALLQHEQSGRAIWIIDGDESIKHVNGQAAEFKAYMARHGISMQLDPITSLDKNVPTTLDSICQSGGHDFVIAGAYGESRLREFLLGGVTRHLLRSSRVPVFMSH